MRTLAATLSPLALALALASLLAMGCGGETKSAASPSAPPPTGGGDHGPTSAAPAPTSGEAKGKAEDKPGAGKPDQGAPAAEARGSGDPGAAAGGKAPGEQRVEQMKVNKTTSAGGSYGVAVASASGMSSDDVGKALVGLTPKTDVCYAALFKKQMGVKGKTSFDVVVSQKGKTQSVKVRSDDMKSADLVKCLEGVLKAVEWTPPADKAGGKTTIEWFVEGN